MADDATHTALERARFGRRLGSGDRFVGFWLELSVAGRNAPISNGSKGVAKTVKKLLKDTSAAFDEAGEEAVLAELRDAAQLYWGTCLTDPQYSSTLFGMKRLQDAELRGKLAAEFAATSQVMVESAALTGVAAQLPRLFLDGLLLAVPGLESQVQEALAKKPAVAALVADRL